MTSGRWPPIYDAKELADQIAQIASREAIEKWFFDSQPVEGWCQGDLLAFTARFPHLNEGLQPAGGQRQSLWVLLSNTCDLDRSPDENPWAKVAPLVSLGALAEIPTHHYRDIRNFKLARKMFWPHWPTIEGDQAAHLWCIDWTQTCTLSRRALQSASLRRCARLSYAGWILFHCALVRFLARDDGRMDP